MAIHEWEIYMTVLSKVDSEDNVVLYCRTCLYNISKINAKEADTNHLSWV